MADGELVNKMQTIFDESITDFDFIVNPEGLAERLIKTVPVKPYFFESSEDTDDDYDSDSGFYSENSEDLDLSQNSLGSLEELLSNEEVSVETPSDSSFTENSEDQGILETRLLAGAVIDSRIARKALTELVSARFEHRGIKANQVSDKQFEKETIATLVDLRERGISLDQKLKTDKRFSSHPNKLRDNIKTVSDISRNLHQLMILDKKLLEFCQSDQCPKWNPQTPLYRGGFFDTDSKITRNMLKTKEAFKPGLINYGGEAYGKGLYLTTNPEKAAIYFGHKDNGSITQLWLKKDTPLIDISSRKTIAAITKHLSINEGELIDYLNNKTKVAAIICHLHECYTAKAPHIIDESEVYDDERATHKASFHKTDETGSIKGRPKNFQSIRVANPHTLDLTPFSAEGYHHEESGQQSFDVYRHLNEQGKTVFVVQSPLNKGEYWLAKPKPNSPNAFILEPEQGFLEKRYNEKKRELLSGESFKDTQAQARKNLMQLRQEFNKQHRQ